MRRRVRRRKFTWFPVRGAAGPAETGDEFSGQGFQLSVSPDGSTIGIIQPLIPDVPLEGDDIDQNAPGQLVQSLGQEYVVERIVGNLFLHYSAPLNDPPTVQFPESVLVGAGIFVARAEDSEGGGPNAPIGSLTATEFVSNYSPLGVDTIREPWMWRRTWVLSANRSTFNGVGPFQAFRNQLAGTGLNDLPGAPAFNGWYGSEINGPFFDVRSVRRVRNDERLWFIIAARTLDVLLQRTGSQTSLLPNQQNTDGLVGYLDYRVLGALRRAQARSNF